ncbi:hypothetical protein [Microbispora siamensis]|uniref:Uncharacterized protein n=1 Tax=Microbispora siamensis TaxID=564413 RepID=A0ABQ4GNE4_9ACTN|nr:hypothetical protein [Microbispora siamensis]GIH62938.1 hypothetical protein Msi02_37550 [Microbispora siamensis]
MNDKAAHPRRIAWIAPAVVNLILGCAGVFPLGFLWIFLAQYPLAALGLTDREPTDNDGIVPWLILLVGGVGTFIVVWMGINAGLRKLSRLARPQYWLFSTALSLLPFAALAIFPDIGKSLGLF